MSRKTDGDADGMVCPVLRSWLDTEEWGAWEETQRAKLAMRDISTIDYKNPPLKVSSADCEKRDLWFSKTIFAWKRLPVASENLCAC